MNLPASYALSCLVALLGTVCLADEPTTTEKGRALKEGEQLPPLAGTDEEGRQWNSAEHIGKKILVLYVYPGDFTPGCMKQAEAFREGLAKLEERGVELVGISGDEAATHKLFKETYDLKHRLLADPKGELAQTLGVPVGRGGKVRPRGRNGDVLTQRMHRADGIPLPGETSLFTRPVTMARWTIVADRQGAIASIRRDVNPATDAQEVLEIVDALSKAK